LIGRQARSQALAGWLAVMASQLPGCSSASLQAGKLAGKLAGERLKSVGSIEGN